MRVMGDIIERVRAAGEQLHGALVSGAGPEPPLLEELCDALEELARDWATRAEVPKRGVSVLAGVLEAVERAGARYDPESPAGAALGAAVSQIGDLVARAVFVSEAGRQGPPRPLTEPCDALLDAASDFLIPLSEGEGVYSRAFGELVVTLERLAMLWAPEDSIPKRAANVLVFLGANTRLHAELYEEVPEERASALAAADKVTALTTKLLGQGSGGGNAR